MMKKHIIFSGICILLLQGSIFAGDASKVGDRKSNPYLQGNPVPTASGKFVAFEVEATREEIGCFGCLLQCFCRKSSMPSETIRLCDSQMFEVWGTRSQVEDQRQEEARLPRTEQTSSGIQIQLPKRTFLRKLAACFACKNNDQLLPL
jgi:hypothetical protein